MKASERIKSDLATYFSKNGITDAEKSIVKLKGLLHQSVLEAEGLTQESELVKAWTALQLQEGLPFRYDVKTNSIYNIDTVVEFKTKRFLYNIITTSVLNKTGCFAITGSRRVGKTILLKQLYNDNMSSSEFLDCSVRYPMNFNEYYNTIIQAGKKYVFIDEVCKLTDNHCEFVSATKAAASKLCIIITGSTSFVIEDMCEDIGRGEIYTLPPFMYIETLSWQKDATLNDVMQYVSNESFITYLKSQFMSNMELIDYMRGVVHDTIASYRNHSTLEGEISLSTKELDKCLIYISVCQLLYRRSTDNQFIDMPNIGPVVKECLRSKDIFSVTERLGLKNNTIETVLDILCSCNLAKKIRVLKDTHNTSIDAFLFEYPWYVSYCLSPSIQDSEILLDLWVEYYILMKAYYVYSDIAKFRTGAQEEIDVLYRINGWLGLEIKNRPDTNLTRKYKAKLQELSNTYSISDIFISNKSCNAKIAASLELEYIRLLNEGLTYSTFNIQDLLNKYF